jgi:DNA-binding protein HU-beta
MNKFDLIDEIALKMRTKEEASKFVEEIIGIIKKTLIKGEEIRISGLGTFKIRVRAPKIGRIVKRNIAIKLPASKTVKFKPSKQLLKSLNK